MPHDHSHPNGHGHLDARSGDRRVSLAIWANAVLTVAQIIGGVLSGSLALIADALHNFSDIAALLIAFAARKIARRPADAQMTFGYARVEVVAALINYTSLVIIGLFLIYEGGMRLLDPPEVAGWTVVIVACLALLVDALTAVLTYSMQKDSVNIRALFLHNLSDALASGAVALGGGLIILYDWRLIDPIVTIGIASYILYLALREITAPIRMLMLGSPADIDNVAVITAVSRIEGVARLHHVHFWQMQEHQPALDVHVVLTGDGWQRQEQVKAAIKQTLNTEFGIRHSTLEFETEALAGDGVTLYGCAPTDPEAPTEGS